MANKKKKKKKKPSGLQPIRSSIRVPRNKPCPCGSGKKAKRCCLGRIKTLEAIPAYLRSQVMAASILQQPIISEIGEPAHPASVNAADCELEVTSEENNHENP